MSPVADEVRAESRRRLAALTPSARIQLALRLGDADVALMRAARAMTGADVRRLVARSRQAGRVRSRVAGP